MSSSKKLTLKRLLIYLVLAFVPFYIIIPAMWSYFGEPVFICEDAVVAVYCFGVFGMMIPSFAHLITRLVTKEGFKNSFLGAYFKGKMGYWTASVIVPIGYSAVIAVLVWELYMDGVSFSDAFGNIGLQSAGILLIQIAYSVICFFPAFGEEWGWRGYMMPKLMELMPKPLAVLVGGVLWGLWHAPLTVAGHNFGVDYPGYPFVGIGMMCLMCTALNAFLTLLTERTKSVYPAAFTHALNNNINMTIWFLLFGSETAVEKLNGVTKFSLFLPMICVTAVGGIICFALLMKKEKPESAELDKAA